MLLPLIEMVFGRSFMHSNGKSSYFRFWAGSRPQPGSHPNGASSRPADGPYSRKKSGGRSRTDAAVDPYGELELGDAVPCKTEISSSPAESRLGNSQESILRDGGAVVRHDRVVVAYESRNRT